MLATSSISTIIRGTVFVLFILSLFGLGFSGYVYFAPHLVWPEMQLWRLVTYPLAVEFLSLITASICFGAPGEEIETMFGKRNFSLSLLAVTLIPALLYLALFWGEPAPALAGATNLSLFVLTGYVYLFPSSSVRIIFFDLRSKVLLAVLGGLSVAVPLYNVFDGGASPITILSSSFGLLIAALWFHVRYQKYDVLLGPIRSVERLFGRGRKGPIAARGRNGRRGRAADPAPRLSDEDRLNAILDQIRERGVDSLSEEDRRFLQQYSSRL